MELMAHRGASGLAPENTLAAFKLAWEQGADADELDVHLTKDGHVVAIHDADTRRTAGVSKEIRASAINAANARRMRMKVGFMKSEK